eukprot:2970183-Lingulodinium_polyedra.AAC.1
MTYGDTRAILDTCAAFLDWRKVAAPPSKNARKTYDKLRETSNKVADRVAESLHAPWRLAGTRLMRRCSALALDLVA